MTQSPQEKLAALAQRAIPFLRDEGARYEDDGSNEPLELARDIEQALSEHGGGGEAAPFGWVFQHDETGRMAFCPNDGVNTPEVFAELNPRYTLCAPADTTPPTPSVPVGVEAVIEWCDQQEAMYGEDGTAEGDARASTFRAVRQRLTAALAGKDGA